MIQPLWSISYRGTCSSYVLVLQVFTQEFIYYLVHPEHNLKSHTLYTSKTNRHC